MKRGFILYVLIAFMALSTLGFIIIMHSGEHSVSNCIFVRDQGLACPDETLVSSLFHLDALKRIITTLASEAVLSSFLLVALLFSLVTLTAVLLGRGDRYYTWRLSYVNASVQARSILTRWLSRLEVSPTIV